MKANINWTDYGNYKGCDVDITDINVIQDYFQYDPDTLRELTKMADPTLNLDLILFGEGSESEEIVASYSLVPQEYETDCGRYWIDDNINGVMEFIKENEEFFRFAGLLREQD